MLKPLYLRVVSKRVKTLFGNVHRSSVVECFSPLGFFLQLPRLNCVNPQTFIGLTQKHVPSLFLLVRGHSPSLEELLLQPRSRETDAQRMHAGVKILIVLIATPFHKCLNNQSVPLLVNECEHRSDCIVFANQRVPPAKKIDLHPSPPVSIQTMPHLSKLELVM